MDYQLKPLGKTCAATGQPLAPGSVCHSVVVERQGQYVRLDYAASAWTGPPADAIGHWKQRVPLPKSVGQRIDPDTLMPLFEQLCEEGSPSQDEIRYASALVLLRAKRLLLEDLLTTDDGEFLRLAGARGEGTFEIRKLDLPDEQLAALQQQLRGQLAGGWAA